MCLLVNGWCNSAFASKHPAARPTATPTGDALLQSAYTHFYDLEYDKCIEEFETSLKADPENPTLINHVLQAELFRELYRLNLLDTTLYAREGQGFLSGARPENADSKVRERIMKLSDQALAIENSRLQKNSDDIDALFARGETRGYRSTYFALVDKNSLGALRLAMGARNDHEHVLKLDPANIDAKLVIGSDEYVVGSLPLAVRLMAGLAGVTGNKKKGLAYLQDVAEHSQSENVDARIALALFLRREARYADALKDVRSLGKEYPRNFLFALEEANLLKDSGQGLEAIAAYTNVVAKAKSGGFAQPHTELAAYGLAESLRGQKKYQEALEDYEFVRDSTQCSRELRQRASLAAGEVLDILGMREQARQQYQATIAFDSESVQAESARKWLKSPYRGA